MTIQATIVGFKIFVIALILAFGPGLQQARAQDNQTERIPITELKEKLDSGAQFLLIDVREDHELERDGAIAGAIHIPMGDLDARMRDIPKNIDLVFY